MVDKDEELGNQFSLSINTQTGLSGTSQKPTLYFTLSKSTQFVQMNRGGEGMKGGHAAKWQQWTVKCTHRKTKLCILLMERHVMRELECSWIHWIFVRYHLDLSFCRGNELTVELLSSKAHCSRSCFLFLFLNLIIIKLPCCPMSTFCPSWLCCFEILAQLRKSVHKNHIWHKLTLPAAIIAKWHRNHVTMNSQKKFQEPICFSKSL